MSLGRRTAIFGALTAVGVAGVGAGIRMTGRDSPPQALAAAQARGPAEPTSERNTLILQLQGRPPTEWGTDVTGMTVRTRAPSICLTFDGCGGPDGDGVDHRLLDLLRTLQVPATLFLSQRWIEANPVVSLALAREPLFELASHGRRHLPLSVTGRSAYGIRGTRSVGEVYDEVTVNQEWFVKHTGRRSAWMRPGTAFADDVAALVAREVDLPLAGFSINGDGGASFSPQQVYEAVRRAGRGDIVFAHLNHPSSGTAAGMERAVNYLAAHGATFARLSDAVAN